MAVNFYAENYPTKLVDNEYFDPTEPENYITNPRMVTESEWPILEVSTPNAREFLQLLELRIGDDLTGECPVNELPNVMRRLIKLTNSANARSEMLRDTEQVGNFTFIGVSDERIYRYCATMMEVVVTCMEHGRRLMWA